MTTSNFKGDWTIDAEELRYMLAIAARIHDEEADTVSETFNFDDTIPSEVME